MPKNKGMQYRGGKPSGKPLRVQKTGQRKKTKKVMYTGGKLI